VGSEQIAIAWSTDGGQLRAALELRERVFCDEQGVPLEMEHDGFDDAASHLVALSAHGEVIGTLRLIEENGTAKIGRVAVERAWRRRGVALSMLALALERARAHRCTRARLAAQVEASELYRRAGFEVESAEFQEAGITHVWMGRELEEPSLPGGGDAGVAESII
jgi:predicted GNAT family N-acyltransferase